MRPFELSVLAAVVASVCLAPLARARIEPGPGSSATAAVVSATTTIEPGMGTDSTASPSPWRIELSTYAWLTAINGTIGVRGHRADVDASFADIIDDSDNVFAIAGRVEIGYGRLGAYVDGFYSDLGVNNASGPDDNADVDVEDEQAIVDFGLMYRLKEWQPAGDAAANRRKVCLDLYGGARYSALDVKLSPANEDSRSKEEDWFDPVIGGRFILPFSERWTLSVSGDIGGFGAASDFAWSATALVGYDFHIFKAPATVFFGYRGIGWDYSDGSGADEFTWEVIEHGLLLGLSLQF